MKRPTRIENIEELEERIRIISDRRRYCANQAERIAKEQFSRPVVGAVKDTISNPFTSILGGSLAGSLSGNKTLGIFLKAAPLYYHYIKRKFFG